MDSYDLELGKVVEKIRQIDAKLVCLQLPDGLKPKAKEIEAKISAETKAKVLIWLGSNFGACDLPTGLNRLGVDLLLTWGHFPFHKKQEGW